MNEIIEIIRWILGGAAVVFGAFVSVGNWITLIGVLVTKGSSSFVPLVGGVLAAIGLLILPIDCIWKWAWVPLVTDFGTIPLWTWAGIASLFNKANQSN
ncbi:hypothetical protein N8606_01760 [Akkermansiaceae bacterium]|nr:hypothetical protein [Akkermansiaceae bacterium]MDB4663896.1 hypothetical protein [bacterium]MDA7620028.1 hypothetical protein [Akkermansiaceae bacterium]MDA7646982.1 hypothetical protein [Akkermansiaceae bacterium]MDB4355701.1 hypothetical protein [Akkermansiaceae bacterium]